MQVDIRVDTRAAERYLTTVQRKHIPFAASLALNKTADQVRGALTDEMSVFDRPKSATRKGVYATRSRKTSLSADVGLKSRASGAAPVDEYLAANLVGALPRRKDKRAEILLRNAGVLPPGMQLRPGKGARLDQYGNMSRGQIVQIVSFFRAFGSIKESGRRPKSGDASGSAVLNAPKVRKKSSAIFFTTKTGVWQRSGKKVAQVLTFIHPQTYKKSYDFRRTAEHVARKQFRTNYEAALGRALATAR